MPTGRLQLFDELINYLLHYQPLSLFRLKQKMETLFSVSFFFVIHFYAWIELLLFFLSFATFCFLLSLHISLSLSFYFVLYISCDLVHSLNMSNLRFKCSCVSERMFWVYCIFVGCGCSVSACVSLTLLLSISYS